MQVEITQEALDEAKKERQDEIILQLKQAGDLSNERIADILNLPLEEVQEIEMESLV